MRLESAEARFKHIVKSTLKLLRREPRKENLGRMKAIIPGLEHWGQHRAEQGTAQNTHQSQTLEKHRENLT